MSYTNILPAKTNEKPLKILGIISLIGGIGCLLLSIIDIVSIIENAGTFTDDDYLKVLCNFIIKTIITTIPPVIFFFYSVSFAKKKTTHPTLWISYIALMVYSIFSIVYYDKLYYAGAFFEDLFEGIYYMFDSLIELDIADYFNALSNSAYHATYLLWATLPIVLIVDVAKSFRFATLSKIIAAILMLPFLLNNGIYLIDRIEDLTYYVEKSYMEGVSSAIEDLMYTIFYFMSFIPIFLFWFLVIKKSAKKIKLAPQPMAQPVYQTPVQPVAQPVYQQPVAQPMYQRPVQPVAQPVYQQPVQPVAQPMYQRPVQPQFVTPVQAPVIEDDKPTVMLRPEENFEKKLMELKKLRDAGILTDEDFEKKKTEILSRI